MYPVANIETTYRILGIDPGTTTLGVAVIDLDLVAKTMVARLAVTYNAASMASEYRWYENIHGGRAARLKAHEDNLFGLMFELRPHVVVSEAPYLGRFPQAFEALTDCMNSIRAAVYRYNPCMPLMVVDPTTVKKNVGMRGRMVGKDPVRKAMLEIEELQYSPGVHIDLMDEHSVDATAVAYWRAKALLGYLQGARQ